MTRVSVLLPRKGEDISRTLRSVLCQDVDLEVIVVDDSEAQYSPTDERVRCVEGPGDGLVAALNKGIEFANGDFIARQDADDLSNRGRFVHQVNEIKDRDLDILGSGCYIYRDDEYIGQRHVQEQLSTADFHQGNPIVHGSVMLRKGVYEDLDGYDSAYDSAEDYELWYRAVTSGYDVGNVDFPLYQLNLSSDATTLNSRYRMLRQGQEIRWEYSTQDPSGSVHTAAAKYALRYGDSKRALNSSVKAITDGQLSGIAMLALAVAPQKVTDVMISIVRTSKNRRITRQNSQYRSENI